MDRRSFLIRSGFAALPCFAWPAELWSIASALCAEDPIDGEPATSPGLGIDRWQRPLVLVELQGGNDGLNTVVPRGSDEYYRLRPRLGIPADRVLPLDDDQGLHPSLGSLLPVWEEGELAIVHGLGYPRPNRSHFRSVAIWETGSDSDEGRRTGWLAELFHRAGRQDERTAEGVVLDGGDRGPLAGGGARALSMRDLTQFVQRAEGLAVPAGRTGPPALRHLLEVRRHLKRAAEVLRNRLERVPEFPVSFETVSFETTAFGRQVQSAARLIAARAGIPVVKITLGGFDTHTGQAGRHAELLRQLGRGLSDLRAALRSAGLWEDVLVVTYSEFGRRVAENASRGTDHGTAAPHLVLGGRVRGGVVGTQPSLADLDGGDLRHTVDFRRLYATVATHWWGLDADTYEGGRFEPIDCLRPARQTF